ncbi:MAG: efflux RND transporter periplasmic adaptor subunit [bacterium]
MKKIIFPIALAAVVAAGFILVLGNTSNSPAIETIKLGRGDISDSVKATGRVEAVVERVLRAEAEGKIVQVLKEEGDKVRIGEELVLFDLADLDDAVARAGLEIEQAEIAMRLARTKLDASERTYEDPIERASYLKDREDGYRQAVLSREAAERELAISRELYAAQAESLLSLKAKEDRLKKALIDQQQAERELDQAREYVTGKEKSAINLSMLKAEYEKAVNQKKLAEVTLREILRRRKRLSPTSPLNGQVTMCELKEGMIVTVGQALMTLADTENLRVRAEIDELDAGRIQKGHLAAITFDAFPDRTFTGRVSSVAPQARIKENRTIVETVILLDAGTDILLDAGTELLKIANQVDVKIIRERKCNVLVLPLSAIQRDTTPFVWLYHGGAARKMEVSLGLSDMDSIEVTRGLKEGDEVIISSSRALKDGEKVRAALR